MAGDVMRIQHELRDTEQVKLNSSKVPA